MKLLIDLYDVHRPSRRTEVVPFFRPSVTTALGPLRLGMLGLGLASGADDKLDEVAAMLVVPLIGAKDLKLSSGSKGINIVGKDDFFAIHFPFFFFWDI